MPHITMDSGEPGIRGLLRYRPETGRPLSELAEVLLSASLVAPDPPGPALCRTSSGVERRIIIVCTYCPPAGSKCTRSRSAGSAAERAHFLVAMAGVEPPASTRSRRVSSRSSDTQPPATRQQPPAGLRADLLDAQPGYALRASAGPARTQARPAAPAGGPQAGQPGGIRQQLGHAAGARNGDDRPDAAARQRQPLSRPICRGIVRHGTHNSHFPLSLNPRPLRRQLRSDSVHGSEPALA